MQRTIFLWKLAVYFWKCFFVFKGTLTFFILRLKSHAWHLYEKHWICWSSAKLIKIVLSFGLNEFLSGLSFAIHSEDGCFFLQMFKFSLLYLLTFDVPTFKYVSSWVQSYNMTQYGHVRGCAVIFLNFFFNQDFISFVMDYQRFHLCLFASLLCILTFVDIQPMKIEQHSDLNENIWFGKKRRNNSYATHIRFARKWCFDVVWQLNI